LAPHYNDIAVILLNVALNTIHLTLYLQRHIPTYLFIYIFIRIIDFIQFLLVIFISWWVSNFHNQKQKYYIIRIKKRIFGNRFFHLYTDSYLLLVGKYIYLNLYTDICLPLVGKYILKYYIVFLFLHRYMSRYRVMTPFILHIKSYISD
jgi:hypothetical protein